jgi:putative transposase
VVITIAGQKHWLWRAVDQDGIVLDVLVQRRRDQRAAKRLLRKLLKKQGQPPRIMITDKLPRSPVSRLPRRIGSISPTLGDLRPTS